MLKHIHKIYKYEFWAMRRSIASLENNQPVSAGALSQAAHILLARRAWLTRLDKGESFDIDIWPELPAGSEGVEFVKELSAETENLLGALLATLTEESLAKIVEYRSYSGEAQQRELSEILVHMVNHGSYHRGNLASIIRNDGGVPVSTDYIEFCGDSVRQNSADSV